MLIIKVKEIKIPKHLENIKLTYKEFKKAREQYKPEVIFKDKQTYYFIKEKKVISCDIDGD